MEASMFARKNAKDLLVVKVDLGKRKTRVLTRVKVYVC